MHSQQEQAFNAVKTGRNVFITGPAGTGKSYLIQQIKEWAYRTNKTIALTALTGCAAVLIGGRTLHSTLSLGLGKGTAEDITAFIERNRVQMRRIKGLHILVIDEVSMMSDELFDKVSGVLSLVRRNPRPFGGLQLILCGDFAQLPPVSGNYCFKSPMWSKSIDNTIFLTQLMRQDNPEFQAILGGIREGVVSKSAFKVLKGRLGVQFDGNIQPTILYSLRRHVDEVNQQEYNALISGGAMERVYHTSYGETHVPATTKWADNVGIPKSVKICIGAQVVITANIDPDNGVVNGSRGVVTNLLAAGPEVELVNGNKIVVGFKKMTDDTETLNVQYWPIQFAWALTVNKSQGMTLDRAAVDLGPTIFSPGQAYTALSRVRDLESLCILSLSKQSFITHPDVREFYGFDTTQELQGIQHISIA